MEMKIGLPVKRGEDIYIRDEDGNITGMKTTAMTMVHERPEEIAARSAYHDAKIEHERLNSYKNRRSDAYPGFGEFADMIYWKIDATIAAGQAVTNLERLWYEKCKDIKAQYPKPDAK